MGEIASSISNVTVEAGGGATAQEKEQKDTVMRIISSYLRMNRSITPSMRSAIAEECELWDGIHRMPDETIRGFLATKVELARHLLYQHVVYHSGTERQGRVMILACLVYSAIDFKREEEDPKGCAKDAGLIYHDLDKACQKEVLKQWVPGSSLRYTRADIANMKHIAQEAACAGFGRGDLNGAVLDRWAQVLVAVRAGKWVDDGSSSAQTAQSSASFDEDQEESASDDHEFRFGDDEDMMADLEGDEDMMAALRISRQKQSMEKPIEPPRANPKSPQPFEPTDLERDDLVEHPDWEVSVRKIPQRMLKILAKESETTARPVSVEGKFALQEGLRSRLARHCGLMLPEADNTEPWHSMKHTILWHLRDALAKDYRDLNAVSPAGMLKIATLVNEIQHREQRKQRLMNPHSAATKVATKMDQQMYGQ